VFSYVFVWLSQIEETRISVTSRGKKSSVQQVLWTKDDLSAIDQVNIVVVVVITKSPKKFGKICMFPIHLPHITSVSYFPPPLQCVTTLPCENHNIRNSKSKTISHPCHISHHTYSVSLHYLVKNIMSEIANLRQYHIRVIFPTTPKLCHYTTFWKT